MNKEKRRCIFEAFQKHNPHPKTELHFKTPFELLIAVILSAQSTDKAVNKVCDPLFLKANTPAALVALGEEQLKLAIQSIGLFKTKARHIIQTCHILIEQYQGNIPSTRSGLEALPGVGRKTANVILNTIFKQPVIAVDTHIFRVANRTGLSKGNTPLAVEKELESTIEPEFLLNAHHWLVLHGRYVCVARKPHCAKCILSSWCEYDQKNW